MQLKIPTGAPDPQHTEASVGFRTAPIGRRGLLVGMSLTGAALLLGRCEGPSLTPPRPGSSFWSDGTGWVE